MTYTSTGSSWAGVSVIRDAEVPSIPTSLNVVFISILALSAMRPKCLTPATPSNLCLGRYLVGLMGNEETQGEHWDQVDRITETRFMA
jgi:hypothetical protein